MISSVIAVLKLRRVAFAVLHFLHANIVVWVVLAWTLTTNGDLAAAQLETAQPQQYRVATTVPRRTSVPSSHHDANYLDRPQSYTPVRSVPFNYGADIVPSLRQILPKY